MLIHAEEKPYAKSIHTEEEPHIYDFILVRIKENPVHISFPLSNLLVKINYIMFTETLGRKVIADVMNKSSLFILFCRINADFHQRATFIL